ncbi:MAG: response regulator transcription factor [Bacillota bacterium]|nr:response regulator transcription factor [Bacillota bacterium]
MNNKRTVLIAQAEHSINKFIYELLKSNNYLVISAESGMTAISMTKSYIPDMILLDLDLPDMDGTEIIKDIRDWSNIPIIVVSSRDHERDKVTALDLGADDYITKPFSTEEFLARIRTALRHKRTNFDDEMKKTRKYTKGSLAIDFDRYYISVDNDEVHLTNIEFKLIELLCKYSGRVLTYDYILKEIWGPAARKDNKTLRVNMANIRRKTEKNPAKPEYFFTEPGVGYKMAEPD